MPKLLSVAPLVDRNVPADVDLVAAALRAAARDVGDGSAEHLQRLVRKTLAPLGAEGRASILERLTHELEAPCDPAEASALAEALAKVARVLRERLPYVSASGIRTLSVETLVGIDEHTYYARGVARDNEAEVASLVAVSPEGSRSELVAHLADGTFSGCFELPVRSLLDRGWTFELRNAKGGGVEVEAPPVVRDAEEARSALLAELEGIDVAKVHPAVKGLQARLRRSVAIEAVHEFGLRDPAPEITVIVPLGRRHHLFEQQLAQFAHDPQMSRVDLIYVLAGPEHEFLESAAELERLYRVPFRVLALSLDPGDAVAADLGARLSDAPLLAFLDPDVVPAEPGWLETLAQILASDRAHGAVLGTAASDRLLTVASESSVCLLLTSRLYGRLGGFRDGYVTHEAAVHDLCLHLRQAGYRHREVAGIGLDRRADSWWSEARSMASLRSDHWLLQESGRG